MLKTPRLHQRHAGRIACTVAIALLMPMRAAVAQRASSPASVPTMTLHATGSFDVTITPRPADPASPAAPVGIMSLDKTFHGDLEAHSAGEMLASRIPETGAAAYVALERVSGTLGGRQGTFVLAHLGTMTKDAQKLVVTVVPGSGTGELAGLSGTMTIRQEGKAHFYTMDYTLE